MLTFHKILATKVLQGRASVELSVLQLDKIWNLADADSGGNLTFNKFCIGVFFMFDIIDGVRA